MADLDESLAALRALDINELDLHPFQREMVLDAFATCEPDGGRRRAAPTATNACTTFAIGDQPSVPLFGNSKFVENQTWLE